MNPNASSSLAAVVKLTAMPEVYVLLSAVLVAAVVVAALRQKSWTARVRKAFVCICVAMVAGTLLGIAAVPTVLRDISQEGHVVEWLTADLLLSAWVIGIVVAVRLAIQKRPSPLAIFLTFGYFIAFCRELEYGEPFVGEKIFYSRYLFCPRAYVNAACFDGIAGSIGLSSRFLYRTHLMYAAAIMIITALVVWYLLRHRWLFIRQLRELPWTSCGRFFLAGVGVYVLSQVVERLFEYLLLSRWLADWTRAHTLTNEILGEPVELVGSMFIAMSMVALWHERVSDPQAAA